MPDELEAVGEKSLDRWGSYVLTTYGNYLIPIHDMCRCRIVAGQWICEPDACRVCRRLQDEWNSVVQMPSSFEP